MSPSAFEFIGRLGLSLAVLGASWLGTPQWIATAATPSFAAVSPAPVAAGGETCFATLNGITVYSSTTSQAVRDAVNAAASGSMVKLAGYCPGVATQSGTVQTVLITKTLTLAGGYTTTDWTQAYPLTQPTTLDALNMGRVVYATAQTTLQGFTLTQGYINAANISGGGVYADAPITLTHMVLYSNTALGTANNGGGLYAMGTATVSATRFLSNVATNRGGGAYFSGVAHLNSSLFANNRIQSNAGGGAYFNVLATLTDTHFSANTVITGNGGGAYFNNVTVLVGSVFSTNTAPQGNGGGAYLAGSAQISASTFTSNTANIGGGMQLRGAANVTNTAFIANAANQGGGMYMDSANVVRLTNLLFARNRATTNGSGVYVGSNNTLHLLHTTFVSPTVAPAQAIYITLGTTFITNTLIASHTVGIGRTGGSVTQNANLFYNNGTHTVGTVNGGPSAVANPAFYDHTAYTLTTSSAAIDAGVDAGINRDYFGAPRPQGNGPDIGYAEAPYPALALPVQCYATPNDGTTVYSSTNASAVQVALNAANAGNVVKLAGTCAGLVVHNGSTQLAHLAQPLTLAGGYTITNWLTPNLQANPTVLDAQGLGRGLFVPASGVTLQGFTLTNGNVPLGGLLRGGGLYATGAITLTDMVLYNNRVAAGQGGGAWLGGMTTLTNTTFLSNATTSGGGAFFNGATQAISTTFTYNQGHVGGGAYFSAPQTLSGLTFISNTASSSGGGASFERAATLSNALFLSNTAQYFGAGAYFEAPAIVFNTIFTGNAAVNSDGGNGGGAYFDEQAILTNTHFFDNYAARNGGGAYFGYFGAITAATFSRNRATYGGGAVLGSYVWVAQTAFISNTASQFGGGATLAGEGIQLDSTLFLSNTSASGGGAYIYSTASGITLTQSTFAHNAAVDGGGVFVSGPITTTATRLMGNTASNNGGGAYFEAYEPQQHWANGLFARNTAGGLGAAIFVSETPQLELLHLTLVSPTVNNNAAIYVLTGNVRLINTLIASHTVGIAQAAGTLAEDYNLFAEVTTPYSGVANSGSASFTGPAAFVNPAIDDYRLTSASAALNAGAATELLVDFEGEARPRGGGFDIGFDETSDVVGLNAVASSPTLIGNSTAFTATLTAGNHFTYAWDFGDGSPISSLQSPSHTYTATGNYTATLTATNNLTTLVATVVASVVDVPIASLVITNSSPTALGNPTWFTATLTSGTQVTYTWDFGNGATASGATVSYMYPTTGWYTATLTATNSASSQTLTTPVSVFFRLYLPYVRR